MASIQTVPQLQTIGGPGKPATTAIAAPVAVVVGAGPAGVAAASALALRGYKVEVFERRDELLPTGKTRRGYPMVLNGRATSTLKMAGMDISSAGATIPQEGYYFNGRLGFRNAHDTREGSPGPSYVVDRLSLGRGMYEAVAAEGHAGADNIRWHWGQTLEEIDLQARRCVFGTTLTDGPEEEQQTAVRTAVSYQLLVGADGYRSAVRQALERENQLKTEQLVASQGTYKTFHNVPVTDECNAIIPDLTTHAPNEWIYSFAGPGAPNITMWKADDRTMSGMMGGGVGYEKEDLAKGVAKLLSAAPVEWQESIVAQTHSGSGQIPSPYGEVLKVSQFHGPSCVLLGDAAHPVTSTLGGGCNLALESVKVFINTLDAVGLEAAPEAFTKARLADAHAFQTLEFTQVLASAKQPTVIKGEHRMPSGMERVMSILLMQLSWAPALALHRLLPFIFKQPKGLMQMLKDQELPFNKALKQLQLQAGLLVASSLATMVVVVGVAAKAAAAALTSGALA